MNTFWLKMAGIVVVILVVIVLVNVFSSSEPEPEREHKPETFYEQIREDNKRLRADPELRQPPVTSPLAPLPATGRRQGGQEKGGVGKPVKPAQPQFKELSEEDEMQAQKLYEWALTQRKMGRLPAMGYKKMVDACREIIARWPDSVYAFKAKRMLADIPERYRSLYHITEEEIDLGDWK